MIHTKQLQELIKEVLEKMDMYSKDAEYLLIGTCAQESRMGTFLKQVGGGPALGIFQMEPATERDVWENFLSYKRTISDKIDAVCGADALDRGALRWDLAYQIIMARLQYYRRPEPLPSHTDVKAMGEYWKQWYNTPLGHGTVEQFINNFPQELKA